MTRFHFTISKEIIKAFYLCNDTLQEIIQKSKLILRLNGNKAGRNSLDSEVINQGSGPVLQNQQNFLNIRYLVADLVCGKYHIGLSQYMFSETASNKSNNILSRIISLSNIYDVL
jgi:hypothetical protein